MKSSTHEGCTSCKHRGTKHGWCYMFTQKPEEVPCGQHDMYAKQREENGKRLLQSLKRT